uniref:L-Fucosyltransferase n=1 Tax=Haemonchus contortus TaxID=6289 RepID=A0A7I5ED51_HAECO
MNATWKIVLTLTVLGQIYLVFRSMDFKYSREPVDAKYVGFFLNGGRLGNQLVNNSDKYILLNFIYGQNPRFFDEYLGDVRQFLTFSRSIRDEGDYAIDSLKIKRNSWMCIHIRRTDFIERNISTDVNLTVNAANSIAKLTNVSHFLLFGDDQTFMKDLANKIIEHGKWQKDMRNTSGCQLTSSTPMAWSTSIFFKALLKLSDVLLADTDCRSLHIHLLVLQKKLCWVVVSLQTPIFGTK